MLTAIILVILGTVIDIFKQNYLWLIILLTIMTIGEIFKYLKK